MRVFSAAFLMLLPILVLVHDGCVPGAYRVTEVQADGKLEYRFFHQNHHFMTLIADPAGSLAIRPHPGLDVNGWGSTWYPQAFLPPGDLKGASVDNVHAAADGIHVTLTGQVSRGPADAYGTWSFSAVFSDDRTLKKITGTGEYAAILDAALSSGTGDLNLYKIASNFLDDVPLLGDGTGGTGDMAQADISGGTAPSYDLQFTWIPPDQPAHYPGDTTDQLSVHVIGQHNVVDTAAMGFAPIQAAYKPSMKVVLTSTESGTGLTFGAAYDLNRRQDYTADNVGITPLIRVGNPKTAFHFSVEFESTPLPGDRS